MQIILSEQANYILRFDRGEEVMTKLTHFITAQNIPGATFTALGACRQSELAFYNLETREYQKKKFTEDLEVLSVVGNIAWMAGKPIIHAHGSFSRADYSCLGGHIVSLIAAGTIEVHLWVTSNKLERAFDQATGLNLLR